MEKCRRRRIISLGATKGEMGLGHRQKDQKGSVKGREDDKIS